MRCSHREITRTEAEGIAAIPWPGSRDSLGKSKSVVLISQKNRKEPELNELVMTALEAFSNVNIEIMVASRQRSLWSIHMVDDRKNLSEMIAIDVSLETVLLQSDLYITNGGYEEVNESLTLGVPVIISPTTSVEAFVAECVAWSGLGMNLRTGSPTVLQVRSAVQAILSNQRYQANTEQWRKNAMSQAGLNHVINCFLANRTLPPIAIDPKNLRHNSDRS
jgi:UDP:flavonoid glycosyltransferase YjiC (YdhE family)